MPATHDVFELADHELAAVIRAGPDWVRTALARAPYVVVRRELAAEGMIGVGVRGNMRNERFGTWLPLRQGVSRITPVALGQAGGWQMNPLRDPVPAFQALRAAARWFVHSGWKWGPGGSVGFELATGRLTATDASDLDIIVYAPKRMTRYDAEEMLVGMTGLGCLVDVVLETPAGGVALADYVASPTEVLVRTPHGPVLTDDAWRLSTPMTLSA